MQEGALFSILGRHDTVLPVVLGKKRLILFQRKRGYRMELVAWQLNSQSQGFGTRYEYNNRVGELVGLYTFG